MDWQMNKRFGFIELAEWVNVWSWSCLPRNPTRQEKPFCDNVASW